MAGFFGLFNYEKEGPGIHKNAPKKKTFVVFFETFFRNFWKFITINLVYGIVSVLGVTNGLAHAGLTNVTRNIARDKHSFGLSDFFDTIKKNWKQALGAGIINIIITVLLVFDFYFFFGSEGWMSTIGIGICACMVFIFSIMCFYIWTLMITFKFNLKQIYKNSFKFVFINMKYNLLCGFVILLVNALFIGIALLAKFHMLVITIELMIYICVYPAFSHLLVQFCTFPSIKKYIIDPYYQEHPDEDIEKRKDLGIEIEEEDSEDNGDEDQDDENGAVFSDERVIPIENEEKK